MGIKVGVVGGGGVKENEYLALTNLPFFYIDYPGRGLKNPLS